MANTYKATGFNNLDLRVETESYYARIKKNGNTIRDDDSRRAHEGIGYSASPRESLRAA